ncbi:uncharacterized protein PV09_09405 [Verruconis gallopava]|uniref:RNA polymerase II assembly factor Rtp1 C-terminal domain-containing protein n=1 Tax=Verruconis gallopava TaxID=253628 RepID=A0A0D1ZXM6_9PEZI|nr:uncharacterized protein PV09_09405 [Verruconis gallopava]KIV98834.1 hypothetical protein PV09_09405 [Verruconis gallopava]
MDKQGAERPTAESAIQTAESFFVPALKDRNDNRHIILKLAKTESVNDEVRVKFLLRAGELLQSLHSAVKFEQTSQPQGHAYDSSLLMALYKLTDFLLLEGLYPSLPTGVGQLSRLRSKSLFYSKPDSHYACLRGSDCSKLVLLDILAPILKDIDTGIEPLLRHRALNDIIAGYAWLARCQGRSAFPSSFSSYLERLPTSTLLASYTSFLRNSEVEWFRSVISEQLSALPLRRHGVRNTIEFIAASHRAPQQQPGENDIKPSAGPLLPLEALQQASKLLSSAPRNMSIESYLSQLAPQLFSLLDDPKDPAMRKVAAFIISHGILGKRSIGAPGTHGWRLFVEPVLQAINPTNHASSQRLSPAPIKGEDLGQYTVTQSDLELGLRRLSALALSHPSPGLTGRLIRPLLLPLWALSNYRGLSFSATEASKTAFSVLRQFFNLVGTPQNLCLLADHLLCDGSDDWVFGPGDSGGISIRKRTEGIQFHDFDDDIERALARIDQAAQTLCSLITSSKISDSDLGMLFQHILMRAGSADEMQRDLAKDEDILGFMARGRLCESLVTTFSDRLVRTPDRILDLVRQIIQRQLNDENCRTSEHASPSLTALSNIIQSSKPMREDRDRHSDDIVLVSLSLVNAFAASPSPVEEPGLHSEVEKTLELLKSLLSTKNFDDALHAQIRSTVALLEAKIARPASSVTRSDTDAALDVQRTLDLISTDIASELPPIRRSALYALQALIKSGAPLDVPPIGLILLEVLRTEKEEFVYLAAVQTTVQLAARRNLGHVSRLLTDSFQDIEEQTGVDGRLRIGEVLSGIVDAITEADVKLVERGEIMRTLAHSLLVVASRRGQRKRELLERQREERLQRLKRKEAERAWGGDMPELPVEEDDEETEHLSSAEKKLRLQNLDFIDSIIKGWQDTGYEEDVRLRASSLSILGRVLEQGNQDVQGTEIIANTIELNLSILSLELEPAKAILRRAAAMAMFGMLKGIDSRLESGEFDGSQSLISGENWSKVEPTLNWVVDTDPDDLTVGHAKAVLDGLEAVRMKLIAAAGQHEASLSVESKIEDVLSKSSTRMRKAGDAGAPMRPVIEEIE